VQAFGVGLGEDRADGGSDHDAVALRNAGENVAHEVHPAALPGRPEQHGGDRLLKPGVGVGDDQLGAGQPAGLQRAQQRRPERAVLAVADGEAEHLPVPVGGHPGAITTAWETTRRLPRALQ
jgi:hypothetical protein